MAPRAAGGHSLGEYTALVAADALTFDSALRLVKRRGELMGDHGEGEMSALPVDLETAQQWASRYFCAIGGINLPSQTVIAGAADDLDALESDFTAEPTPADVRSGLRRRARSTPIYMVEAARRFRVDLDATQIAAPTIQVLSNFVGGYHQPDPQQIKACLFFQLFHPVDWVGCVQTALADGIDTFVEFGGGIGTGEMPAEKRPNLEGMIKKATRGLDREVRYFAAINADSIEATSGADPV